jgi:hypothetical protein
MSPEALSRHPGFAPYAGHRDELLGLPAAQWIARCNVLAAQRGLRSAAGVPITFCLCGPTRDALGYEASILHEGRIACRPHGRGALHDLHNALVWLRFPAIKATLNRLHLAQEAAQGRHGPQQCGQLPGAPASSRGRLRDLVTLLDENGLLWLSRARLLDEQLQARDWRALLLSNRERVRTEVWPIVIGHGLLEKLARPYKSMTAHCLVGHWPPSWAPPQDLALVDAAVSSSIAAAYAGRAAARLLPLPILGLPGWDPANIDASYYDDRRVFRAPGT